jgi:hypothetical protein
MTSRWTGARIASFYLFGAAKVGCNRCTRPTQNRVSLSSPIVLAAGIKIICVRRIIAPPSRLNFP